jgi:outer membrane protein OmpA-like peptidoglycan-associated protein
MQRLRSGVGFVTVSLLLAGFSSGCLATRKFTRNEVKTASDNLSAQIDATNSQVKETQDAVNQVNTRVTGVDQRVSTVDQRVTTVNTRVEELDTRTNQTNQNVTTLRNDVGTVRTDVGNVNTKADATNKDLTALDQRFQKRNNYAVSTQKAILFRFDSDKLTDDSKPSLDEIAAAVMANPDAILVLEGHTDSSGDRTYNIRLGERRIEAVRRYLAVDKGVPVYKIEQISFGSEKPIAPNDSKEGREQNRAVTLSIMVPSLEGGAAVSLNR